MASVNELKKYLHSGRVYRRADLARWSKSIDRHLQALVRDGTVKKLSGGIYYCPEKSRFGDLPPHDADLIRAFLKDDHFYMASLNAYNSLGVGATQLYNETLVYNDKRDGRMRLNGRPYYFIKRRFPKKGSREFLMVDLVNNLHLMAEDTEEVLKHAARNALEMDRDKLMHAVHEYGGARARKFYEGVFSHAS